MLPGRRTRNWRELIQLAACHSLLQSVMIFPSFVEWKLVCFALTGKESSSRAFLVRTEAERNCCSGEKCCVERALSLSAQLSNPFRMFSCPLWINSVNAQHLANEILAFEYLARRRKNNSEEVAEDHKSMLFAVATTSAIWVAQCSFVERQKQPPNMHVGRLSRSWPLEILTKWIIYWGHEQSFHKPCATRFHTASTLIYKSRKETLSARAFNNSSVWTISQVLYATLSRFSLAASSRGVLRSVQDTLPFLKEALKRSPLNVPASRASRYSSFLARVPQVHELFD